MNAVVATKPSFTPAVLPTLTPPGRLRSHALRDVDLDIARSEFIVLRGPSGGGKPTLLNILGGLDVPSVGLVRFGEQDFNAATESIGASRAGPSADASSRRDANPFTGFTSFTKFTRR